MRPVPIPDLLVKPNQVRCVIGAPGGDLLDSEIEPVEAVVEAFSGVHADRPVSRLYSVRMKLEGDDLKKLQDGDHVWVHFWGVVVPFSADVGP